MGSNINYIFQYTSNILKPAIETINQNIKSNLHLNNISGSFCNLLNVSINSDKILINTTNITTSDINISSLSNLNNLSEPIITSFNNSSNIINNSSNFIIDSINNTNTSLNTKYITIDSNSSNYNSNIDNDIIKRLNNLNISNIQNGLINKYIENNVIDYNLIINGNVNILNGIISSNTVTSSSKTIANEDLEIISSSSINPALKIQQNNSQNIIEIYGNTNTKFIVNNDGKFGLGKDPTTSNSLELLGDLNSTTGLYSNSLPFSYFGLSNIPLTFTPSSHLHTISDINGLTSALNTKQNIITSLTSNYNSLNINSGLNILSGYNFKENDNILKLESSVTSVVTSNYWNEKSITIIDNNTLKELTNITGTNDFYYAFTSTTGKNSITFVTDTICDVLIVGGGGAGGRYIGGGGGAGGVVYVINKKFQANITYTIKVGNGGTSYDIVGKGLNGEDSYIKLPNDNYDTFDGFNLIGYGGGGGGSYNSADSNAVGKNGGSGGGGGELYSGGNLTIAGQSTQGLTYYSKITNAYVKGGNNGIIAPSNGAWAGSGGGGCSLTENLTNAGRDGRNGIANDITGVNTYYAAGGGAGINQPGSGAPGLGGLGGGGNGSKDSTNTSKNGVNGTGSGGGGDYEYFGGNPANAIGGNGGSGIVIIRIKQQTYSSSISYANTSINANSLILRNYSSNIIINDTTSSPISYNVVNDSFIYEFTTGSNYVNIPYNTKCDILLVGGGGSGGSKLGSGGNSGNVIYSTDVIIPAGNYNIIVGKGGTYGEDGSDTIAFGATAKGGRGIITKIPSAIKATVSPEPIIGSSSYCYYTFTNNGSITFYKNTICDILIVGGGGSGGIGLGGGSSGGLLYATNKTIPNGEYSIIIGAGGINGNGGNSTAFGATAKGGLKATTNIGATNNGANTIGSIITSWDKNLIALAGGGDSTSFFNSTINMIAWYKFDGNANDSSGNTKHLILYNNPTPAYDSIITIKGSSINIDGDTYLENSTLGTYFTPNNLSISFWLYGGSQSSIHQTIASARSATTSSGGWTIYILPNTNKLSFWLASGSSWNQLDIIVSDLFSTSWKFFTITHSSTNALNIYKNGISIYTGSLTTTSRTANNFRIGAGANEVTAQYYLNNGSKIDDFRIYNSILTQEQITILYTLAPSGGGGVGSVGESSTLQIFKPNGGSGFPISIRTPNELFAGGGGANEGLRIPSENIIGYGGNSTSLSEGNGGNGIVIIRVPADNIIRENYGSIYKLNDDNIINNNAVILNKFDSARQNLIAWYKFDGDANDSSGNGYNLTNNGVSFNTTNFKSGNSSADFNSSSSQYFELLYTNAPNLNAINTTTGVSLNFWVNIKAIPGTYSDIFDFGVQYANTGSRYILAFIYNSLLNLEISDGVETATAVPGNKTTYSYTYTINTWYHIVWTINTSGNWTIYINNNILSSDKTKIIPTFSSSTNTKYYIGKSLFTTNGNLGMILDDFRIYNKILSKDEVEYIYSTTNTKSNYLPYATSSAILYNNLRIWYKFSGKLGITDSSIYSLNATATGTPIISNNIIKITQPNYLQLPSNIIDFNNDITISFWYRFDNQVANYGKLIDFQIILNRTANDNCICINRNVITSSLYFVIDTKEDISIDFGHTTSGEMIHLTWVIKKNGIWNIYKNGVSIFSQQCVYPKTNIYTYSYLGKSLWNGEFSLDNQVSLKDFRIYNRSLIPDEIYNIYNQITTTSLVAYSPAPFISNTNFYNDISNMLVWYKFDGNLIDSSGNGLTSTATGTIAYGLDYANNTNSALAFNSSAYFSTSSATANYFFSNYFTVSFWFYSENIINTTEALVAARNPTIANGGWNIYIINRQFSLPIMTSSGILGEIKFDTYFEPKSWKYCTFLFNMPSTSTLTVSLYINSIFRETKPLKGGSAIVAANVQNLAIGSVGGTFTCQTTTKIDDFRIYNRILTNDEISILYNNDYRNLTYLRKGYNLANFYNDITDMIAWYKFENNYNDSSANRYNSFTISGTTSFSTTIKKIGSYGGDFAGGYLTNNSINLNGKSFSVCFWIYKRANVQYSVIGQGNVQATRQSLDIGFKADNKIMFAFWGDDCDSIKVYNDNNTWVHLVYTYDYSTRIRRIYRNNIELPTTGSIAAGNPNFNANTRIGSAAYGGSSLNAVIDDLRMYNRTLTPSEIDIIYNQYNIEEPLESFYNNKNNMIAWYKFDSDYSDSSGNGYNLTNTSCTINTIQQKDGLGCVAFTGSSYLTYGVSNTVFVPTTISVSLWVYYTAIGFSQIISTQSGTNGWLIQIEPNGYLAYFISNNQGIIKSSTLYNQWVHIVMILSSSSTTQYIYLNGILNNTISSCTYTPGIATTLRIGAQVGTANYYMKSGSFVDDVRIYNCILTSTEINILYNQYTITDKLKTFYNNKNDMIAWYKFDGNFIDSSGLITTTPTITGTLNTNYKFDNTAGNFKNGTAALNFITTNSYITIQKPSITNYFSPANSFSISAWIKFTTASILQSILSCRVDATKGWVLWIPANYKHFTFQIYGTTATSTSDNINTITELNMFHHVVCTLNYIASNNIIITIYIDNVRIDQVSTTTYSPVNTNLIIGNLYTGSQSVNAGTIIDEVRIYNKLLTNNEIDILYTQKIYEYSLESFYNNATDMIAWYKFDGDFNDSSGNGNNLTGSSAILDTTNKKVGTSSITIQKYGTNLTLKKDGTIFAPDNFTICFWIYGGEYQNAYHGVVVARDAINLSTKGWGIYRNLNGMYLLYANTAGSWNEFLLNNSKFGTTPNTVLNDWNHVCVCVSGNNVIAYINNQQVTIGGVSIGILSGTLYRDHTALEIGGYSLGGQQVINGTKLDDVRLYNRVLTTSEIALLANSMGGGGGSVISPGKITSTNGSTGGDALIIPMMNYESFAKGGDGFSYNSSSTRLGIGYGGIGSTSLTYNSGGNGTVIIKIPYHPYIVDADKFDQQPTQIPGTNDFYYAFTSTTGTNSITFRYNTLCDILVVGGGGGGGFNHSGGGGAGAYYYGSTTIQANITYSITVGAGGTGGNSSTKPSNGFPSHIKNGITNFLYVNGGGAGGQLNGGDNNLGKDGGCGGGGNGWDNVVGNNISYAGGNAVNIGTNGSGYGGGASINYYNGNKLGGGGGGGIGGIGATSITGAGGNGGDALKINIKGNDEAYGGGGGGGTGVNWGGTAGSGGKVLINGSIVNVGGAGTTVEGANGGNGIVNTGSGGGSAKGGTGGAGGSGIVIIRWTIPGANITSEINNGGVYVDAGNISTLTGDITTYSGNVITNNCIVNNDVIINTLGYTDKQWKIYGNNDNQFDLSFDDSANNSLNWTTTAKIKGNGGTAGYVNFTGMHHCKASTPDLYDDKYIGYIVSSTKQYKSINSIYDSCNIQRNIDKNNWDALPIVDLASEKDKKVFGVIAKVEDAYSNSREEVSGNIVNYFEKKSHDRRLHIAGVGEGGIWVCNYNNTIIESGDYITSSPIPGIGMKQEDDLVRSYTVAKATMDCDFNPKKIPVKILTKIGDEYDKDSNGNYIYSDLLDINGDIIYEDEYEIKYISLDGNIVDEYKSAVNIYKMAFIGCSYNCS